MDEEKVIIPLNELRSERETLVEVAVKLPEFAERTLASHTSQEF
jgi:hypothetical protein